MTHDPDTREAALAALAQLNPCVPVGVFTAALSALAHDDGKLA